MAYYEECFSEKVASKDAILASFVERSFRKLSIPGSLEEEEEEKTTGTAPIAGVAGLNEPLALEGARILVFVPGYLVLESTKDLQNRASYMPFYVLCFVNEALQMDQ